jgi:WD40 repeat protein
VAWNCSGAVIAVASGSCSSALIEHHVGHVLTWNTARSVMNSSQPDVCIDLGTGTCCTSLAFHPHQPSLLAGGSATGAVYMYVTNARSRRSYDILRRWDTSQAAGHLQLHCNAAAHKGAVCGVQWMLDPTTRRYLLLTTSNDGSGCVWSITNRLSSHVASCTFTTQDLGRVGERYPSFRGTLHVACLAASRADHGVFAIGTVGGGVVRGIVNFQRLAHAPAAADGGGGAAEAGGAAIKLLTAHAPHRDSVSAISQPATGVSLSALQVRAAAHLFAR